MDMNVDLKTRCDKASTPFIGKLFQSLDALSLSKICLISSQLLVMTLSCRQSWYDTVITAKSLLATDLLMPLSLGIGTFIFLASFS